MQSNKEAYGKFFVTGTLLKDDSVEAVTTQPFYWRIFHAVPKPPAPLLKSILANAS